MHSKCFVGDKLLSTAFTGMVVRDSEDNIDAKDAVLVEENHLKMASHNQEAHMSSYMIIRIL